MAKTQTTNPTTAQSLGAFLKSVRDIMRKLDTLKRLQAETAAELDALFPATLDRAFKGDWM